ncbi:MAG: alcohol dehydrogenase catalytic domain-containing protein [Pseudomonadota bacterium]
MKALVYTGPRALEFRDAPPPLPESEEGEDEIVVDVEACGICGSDMHAYFGHDARRPAPLILGHEVCGIARGGAYDGARVAVNPLVTCMSCPACLAGRTNLCPKRQIISMPPREGGFAEQVRLPERNLLSVPDGVTCEIAALTEPVAVAWHGCNLAERTLLRPLAACDVLVIGGGAIGVAASDILTARSVATLKIAETNEGRRHAVAGHGRRDTFDPVANPGDENTADLVIDDVGIASTRSYACHAARPGGVIVHLGLGSAEGGIDVRKLTLQEITFLGAYTYTMTDFAETLEALANDRLGPIDWTEQRALADGAAAFAALADVSVATPKVILRP